LFYALNRKFMITKQEKPSKFVQIPRSHIFAVNRTLYTRTDGVEKEELHYLQKLGPNKAMTLDKSVIVHMLPNDEVFACNIVKNSVSIRQAS
jgi:hypothetical protein